MAAVVVLPSPLLPATAYERLAEALRGAGVEPLIVDPSPTLLTGHDVGAVIEHWVKGVGASDVLVAHSNAGLLAPLVGSGAGARARTVFMDAALLPEAGQASLAPRSLRDALGRLADDRGLLPPWTQWWPPATLRTVIPEDLVEAIDRACPRLPVAYFDQRIDAPDGWASAANAYLAFGDTYAAELGFAREHAWPTDRIDAGHLHFLHDPGLVVDRILALADQLPSTAGPHLSTGR